MEYFEKLKSPKWQKKRLEVLKSQEFSCELCGDSETELHVHHPHYKKGSEPWDYNVEDLMCVCKSCHGEWHAIDSEIKILLASADFRMMLLDVWNLLKSVKGLNPFQLDQTLKAISILRKAYSEEEPY